MTVKELICPTCKRKFELPEGYKPIILKENTEVEKKVFICPCCRTQIEVE